MKTISTILWGLISPFLSVFSPTRQPAEGVLEKALRENKENPRRIYALREFGNKHWATVGKTFEEFRLLQGFQSAQFVFDEHPNGSITLTFQVSIRSKVLFLEELKEYAPKKISFSIPEDPNTWTLQEDQKPPGLCSFSIHEDVILVNQYRVTAGLSSDLVPASYGYCFDERSKRTEDGRRIWTCTKPVGVR